MHDVELDQGVLEKLYPAYIRADWDGLVLDVGPSIRRLVPALVPGSELSLYFQIEGLGGENLWEPGEQGESVRLKSHDGKFALFGLSIIQTWGVAFCVSHSPDNIQSAEDAGLQVSDFSRGDASLTRLISMSIQEAMLEETRQAVSAISAAHKASIKAARLQSEFIANVSHELRTPLAGVIGYIDLLAEIPAPASVQRPVEQIAVAARLLERVINDVLDYSQLESGTVRIVRVATRIDRLMDDIIGLMLPRAEAKMLTLSCDTSDVAGAQFDMDGNRFAQVLFNVIDNAIKFTSRGGVDLRATYAGGSLEIVVHDTGPGIQPSDVPMLFRRFSRLENSVTGAVGGTGLGLAISKGIIDLMGGSIQVESQAGQGTLFRIAVPALRAEAPSPSPPDNVASASSASILVADDTPMNLELMTKIIASPRTTIISASNGVEAAKLCREHSFDLIVLDVHMPELDGVAATRAIRNDCPKNRRTPILLLSADCTAETVAAGLAAGATQYLNKPLRAAELRKVVAACLVQGFNREGRS